MCSYLESVKVSEKKIVFDPFEAQWFRAVDRQ